MLHGDILWFFRLRLFLQRLAGSMAGAVTLLGPNFRWTFEARRRCGSRRAPCCTGLRPAVPRLKSQKTQQKSTTSGGFMMFYVVLPFFPTSYVTICHIFPSCMNHEGCCPVESTVMWKTQVEGYHFAPSRQAECGKFRGWVSQESRICKMQRFFSADFLRQMLLVVYPPEMVGILLKRESTVFFWMLNTHTHIYILIYSI